MCHVLLLPILIIRTGRTEDTTNNYLPLTKCDLGCLLPIYLRTGQTEESQYYLILFSYLGIKQQVLLHLFNQVPLLGYKLS